MNKLGVLMMGLLAVCGVEAKTCTWIGHTGNWSDTANWEDGVPTDGDDVLFKPSTGGGGVITIDSDTTAKIASLRFENADAGWNIQGGTLALQEGMVVISNGSGTVKLVSPLASAGGGTDLVKRGGGTLSLSGDNTAFTGRLIVEKGRLQPETDAAYGAVPAQYRADAIILRNGGVLGASEKGGVCTIPPTRGITLEGSGAICLRSSSELVIQSPIVGDGDLHIPRQTGTLRLAAMNTYSGNTYVCAAGDFSWGGYNVIYLDVDNALPATTTLVEADATTTATFHLGTTTQRISGFTTASKMILSGAGTVRFGTEADEDISLTNLHLTAGATLAYAGAGTVTPFLTTSEDATFALEGGSLVVPGQQHLLFLDREQDVQQQTWVQ